MAVRIKRKRRWIPWTLAAIVFLVLFVAVDDPRRDFVENQATMTEDSPDPLLRPIVFDRSADELVEVTRDAGRRIRNWDYIGTVKIGDASTVVFERTSRWLQLKDDIIIRVEDLGPRCRVTGESRSRLEFGDLGQNPRNLRRIVNELFVVLANRPESTRPATHTH